MVSLYSLRKFIRVSATPTDPFIVGSVLNCFNIVGVAIVVVVELLLIPAFCCINNVIIKDSRKWMFLRVIANNIVLELFSVKK
jgi:hypothetical protein